MADTKISQLVEKISAGLTDIFVVVDNAIGGPISKRISFDNLQKSDNIHTLMGYGSMYIYTLDAGAKVVSITDIDTFCQIDSGITSGGYLNGFTFQNGRELRCAVAGTYLVTWSMSIEVANFNNQEIEGTVMIDGAAQTSIAGHAELINGTKPTTISGTGIISLSIGSLVSLSILNHSAKHDVTIDHLSLTLQRVQ